MGRVKLPTPTEIEVIKRFLTESSGMWVEGVRFRTPAHGLTMVVTYRNFADETMKQTLHGPDVTSADAEPRRIAAAVSGPKKTTTR
jgi:hypothetical protein